MGSKTPPCGPCFWTQTQTHPTLKIRFLKHGRVFSWVRTIEIRQESDTTSMPLDFIFHTWDIDPSVNTLSPQMFCFQPIRSPFGLGPQCEPTSLERALRPCEEKECAHQRSMLRLLKLGPSSIKSIHVNGTEVVSLGNCADTSSVSEADETLSTFSRLFPCNPKPHSSQAQAQARPCNFGGPRGRNLSSHNVCLNRSCFLFQGHFRIFNMDSKFQA